MVFPVVIWMWELAYEESWVLKNWCFWTVVLEKTLESPLDCKEIQPVHHKGNQSWVFIRRTVTEAEAPILWPPDAKSWLIGKDPAAGKDWRQEEKGMTEDEMVGWHHQLNGHEFEYTPGVDDGQRGMLQSMGLLRVGHDWATEPNWSEDFTAGTVDKNAPASAAGMGSISGPGKFQMPKVYEIFKEVNNKTFFNHTTWLVRSQFPYQGLNLHLHTFSCESMVT